MHSIAEKMRLSEPTTKNWMKIVPYYRQRKCRPMTLVSVSIRFMRIFARVLWRWSVKRQWVIESVDFRGFSTLRLRHQGTLGNDANIIIQYYLSLVAFPVTPKYMTLNDLDRLFGVKFCFRAGLAGWDRTTSENNCVKTNKDRHILSAVKIFGRNSSFWQYKIYADIRSVGFSRKETSKDSGVSR